MIQIDDLKVYDVNECAEMLRIHPQTVRKYIRIGKLTGQKVGFKKYVTSESIKDFLKGETDSK